MERKHYFIGGYTKTYKHIAVTHWTKLSDAISAFKQRSPRFVGNGSITLVDCKEVAEGLWTTDTSKTAYVIGTFCNIKELEQVARQVSC